MAAAQKNFIYLLFLVVVALQVLCWTQVRHVRARWLNVPPVPGETGAVAFSLGDFQFSYRTIGLMLQNLGDTGGRVTNLKEYDYDRLGGWFRLGEKLDPRSNYMPMLAAFYFGAVDDPAKTAPLADYLHDIGSSTEDEKWRWLAQAIYFKRYKMNDLDTAYRWSLELAAMDKPDMPPWTKQMPAFIKNAEGDRQAAYDIMVEILKSGKGRLAKEEVNAMLDFICKRTLTPEQAKTDPLCANLQ